MGTDRLRVRDSQPPRKAVPVCSAGACRSEGISKGISSRHGVDRNPRYGVNDLKPKGSPALAHRVPTSLRIHLTTTKHALGHACGQLHREFLACPFHDNAFLARLGYPDTPLKRRGSSNQYRQLVRTKSVKGSRPNSVCRVRPNKASHRSCASKAIFSRSSGHANFSPAMF